MASRLNAVHASIVTTNHHPSPSVASLGLDISELALQALTAAAKLSKVPYVQDAAQLALSIVTIIKVSLYFPIFPQSITDQEWEDLGCQESQGLARTIRE